MRKICVVTGSRAEYGLLSGLMKRIKDDSDFELQVIATNMHLSPEFGLTYKDIEADEFVINKKVEMLLSSDSANATAKSVGLGTIGFADAYEDLQPDIVVVLGDRFEILAAVSAALFYKIPIAHLHGGEITEGAYDDSIRHAITKMSHLHFTSTQEYRNRVIQLGESPERVFYVGSLGVENIHNTPILSKTELEENLNFKFGERNLLVTFHPATLENQSSEEQFRNLLCELELLENCNLIFTLPNSDTDGRIIIKMITDFVQNNPKRYMAISSLGRVRYYSVLHYLSAVIGNSSSGIIEVPSFGIPSLNIGNRQKGRITSNSVFHCDTARKSIRNGLHKVLETKRCNCNNPYDKKGTTDNIISVLKNYSLKSLSVKSFYNL